MNILFIASLYKPYTRGGTEVVVQTVVDECKKNHKVTVLSLSEWKGLKSLALKKTKEDGITLYQFFPLNVFSFIHILKKNIFVRLVWHILDVFNVHSFFVIFLLLKKENYDIVCTHNLKGIGYLIPLALRMARKKHIHTVHDFALCTPSGVIVWGKEKSLEHTNFFTLLYKVTNKLLYGSPDRVIFPSRFLKEYYEKYGFFKKSKREVIANPIPLRFEQQLIQKVLKKKLLPINFLFIGQLEEHKGVRFLVDALHAYNGSDIHFTLVGGGRLEEWVRYKSNENKKNIEYKGALWGDAVIPLFESAHYCIVPSLYYENSPMVVYESLAYGIPVIASRIGGIPELISHGKNGFLFSPGNESELNECLIKCIDHSQQEYDTFSHNAKESVREMVSKNYLQKLLEK